MQETLPWPQAAADKSEAVVSAMARVQADKASCTIFPTRAEDPDCSCPARGLLGCSRQKRPSVQMGKTLRYAV